jgi:hypothetical protein
VPLCGQQRATEALTRVLVRELLGREVTINPLCGYVTITPARQRMSAPWGRAVERMMLGSSALGRERRSTFRRHEGDIHGN